MNLNFVSGQAAVSNTAIASKAEAEEEKDADDGLEARLAALRM